MGINQGGLGLRLPSPSHGLPTPMFAILQSSTALFNAETGHPFLTPPGQNKYDKTSSCVKLST